MANASPRDTAIGYDYFWRQRGKISRDDLNEFLTANHRSPISARTYLHYQHLLSRGVRHYIPINKFDVLSALGKLEAAPSRISSMAEAVEIDAQVSRDASRWYPAKVIDRSQVVLGLLITPRFSIASGALLHVRMEGYRDIPTVVIWREHGEDYSRIEVQALRAVEGYRFRRGEVYPHGSGKLVIERGADGKIAWADFYATLSATNQLVEASTDLLYLLSDVVGVDTLVAEPVLEYVSFGSPGEAPVKVDVGLAELVRAVIDSFKHWRADRRIRNAEAVKKELENKQLESQIEQSEELHRIEVVDRTLSLIERVGKLSGQTTPNDLVDAVAGDITKALPNILKAAVPKEKLAGLFEPGTPERGVLSGRLIPAAVELSSAEEGRFTVKVDTKSEEED